MEWRQQTSVSCAEAFIESQRWIEQVTGKSFGSKDFRAALENGVLLCDLINQLKPGVIKRVNRLSTPIAGLDNVTVFLKGCEKLGLNDSQLFHPGDLQDPSTRAAFRRDESSRRLKNVLITIYWLGRKAHLDTFYSGPHLNFKAFEGLLGLALSRVLEDGSNVLVKDSRSKQCNFTESEECLYTSPGYKRENSVDSVDSLDSRTIQLNSEGCGSDAEAEQVFRMEGMQSSLNHIKGVPVPPPPRLLRRQQGQECGGVFCGSPLSSANLAKAKHKRTGQVNPGWIWSKSMSDIPMVYPSHKISNETTNPSEGQDAGPPRVWMRECIKMSSMDTKDSEAKWQDDLTKWKSRRRSTKPDLYIMSQDREHVINQMTNGAAMKNEQSEDHGELYIREPQPRKESHHIQSTSPSEAYRYDPNPQTCAPRARSSATETSLSKTPLSVSCNSVDCQASAVEALPKPETSIPGEENHFPSLASDVKGVAHSFKYVPISQNHIKVQLGPPALQAAVQVSLPANAQTNQVSTLFTTIKVKELTKLTKSSSSLLNSQEKDHKVQTLGSDTANQTGPDVLHDSQHQIPINCQEKTQIYPFDPVMEKSRTTSQQQTNGFKYMSRASSWSGSASLPRGFRRSMASSRLTSAFTARPFGTTQSRVSPLPRMCNVDDDQRHFMMSGTEESSTTNSSLTKQSASVPLQSQHEPSVRHRKANQARQAFAAQRKEVNGASCFRPASLQTSGSSHYSFVQPHLIPQPFWGQQVCHSKSLSLPSTSSSVYHKVDHRDMRVSLTILPNNIPDFGFHTQWDSTGARVKFILPGSPAELCGLCVDDEIVSVNGVSVAHMNYSQWKDTLASALETGHLTMDFRRFGNEDWSTSEMNERSLPTQNQLTNNIVSGGRTSTMSKKDDEVTNGVQSDYTPIARSKAYSITKQIQTRRAEFFQVKGGSDSAISDLPVPSISSSSSSWSWDREEERRRQEKWQEEQERLLQEQYQRDQERLHAEWQKAQQEVLEVRKLEMPFEQISNDGNPLSHQLCVNGEVEESLEGEQLNASEANPRCNADHRTRSPCEMTRLSPAHRVKSFSTSVLADRQQQARTDERKSKGQAVSKAEQDRQRILEEMKKRTQLLTDNSWIRRRSSSFYKEPAYIGFPMKRYESLDNLDTWRHSPITSTLSGCPRPHSAAAAFRPPSRNSCSRYSTGSMVSQKSVSMEPSSCDGEQSTGSSQQQEDRL